MARSVVPVNGTLRWPGTIAVGLALVFLFGPLIAVLWRAEGLASLSRADLSAVWFTIWQAAVSAVVSIGLAIPVARALARRQFRGRQVLVTLLGAPFLLPVIVAILGLLAVFGRAGIVNSFLGALGLPDVSIYGAHGVIIAHVFFNLPLAVRLILQGWVAIPSERFRLAASLNAPIWRVLERPMLASVVPGTFVVIFLICLTSFAVALTLGGGPRATTIELAIYQAFRLSFDLAGAATLTLVQIAICAVVALLAFAITAPDAMGRGLDRVVARWDGSVWGDFAWITAAALFLLLPLLMVVLRGLPSILELPSSVWVAALRSVMIAMVSAGLTVALALALALRGGWLVVVFGTLPLAFSGLVLGAGLFLIVFPFVSPSNVALPVTALVNSLMALPFVMRALVPSVAQVEAQYGQLADGLGLRGWARLRIVLLPRLRRPLGFGAGVAAALSMGDLGVITLFATGDRATLPLEMYRLMGAYQMQAAASAALVLLGLSLGLFWICDRGGRIDADA
ncbi:MAG: thiamine/thiamine pyrophosphate ABC transporter permease ThiP [Octadecabacter sp.]